MITEANTTASDKHKCADINTLLPRLRLISRTWGKKKRKKKILNNGKLKTLHYQTLSSNIPVTCRLSREEAPYSFSPIGIIYPPQVIIDFGLHGSMVLCGVYYSLINRWNKRRLTGNSPIAFSHTRIHRRMQKRVCLCFLVPCSL